MVATDGKPGRDLLESPEEAIEAIADALEFLRREAVAVGMYEISEMIGTVQGRIRDHCAAASGRSGRR